MSLLQALLNGCDANQLDVLDRGLHYGDGVFETLAIRAHQPQLLQAHLQRLLRGAQRLGIKLEDPADLQDEIRALAGCQAQAVLKIIVTRGSGGRGYAAPAQPSPTRLLLLYSWPEYPAEYRRQGVAVRYCTTTLAEQPALAGIKHLNRLEQVLARNEWQDPQIAEGLMSTLQGDMIEGTSSNLFLIRAGELHTPDVSRCGVAGIMRQRVMELAQLQGIPVRIGHYTRADLAGADGLFLTNSLIGIWPIRRLQQQDYPVHPLAIQLQAGLE